MLSNLFIQLYMPNSTYERRFRAAFSWMSKSMENRLEGTLSIIMRGFSNGKTPKQLLMAIITSSCLFSFKFRTFNFCKTI